MGIPSGSAALVLVDASTPLRVEPALFNAMLEGWRCQHVARRLSPALISDRARLVLPVRRFKEFCGTWPWEWRSEQLEAWITQGHWAHSTIRSYEGSLSLFMEFLCDPNYGWSTECLARVGVAPRQICHERNSAVHVAEYEGRPERRPLTRSELQAFFDVADAAVDEAARSARKGWLAAFRDATLFKVIYAWGLRRTEAAMLDLGDFGSNPAAPELGAFGMCQVRFGKALRGSPPRRRVVATILPWSVDVLAQYVEEVRPLHCAPARGPALFLTERGTRISPRSIDERFAAWRVAAELPSELSVHCLRHSYISHSVEDGVDPLFIQYQAGHSWASTTAGYTKVGSDHMNKMLRSALDRAFLREEK
jgi:integrase/recombinase XerC